MATTYGSGNSSITYSTGIVLDTGTGERPKPTPKELIATRATETLNGWVGQIIMSGEIVYETEPQNEDEDDELSGSEKALEIVNTRIHEAFKRLITGKK